MKRTTYNWRKLFLLISTHLIETVLQPLTLDIRKCLSVIDHPTYVWHRSKVVELLSQVKDHSSGAYMKGFCMLTVGWSDGATFRPLAFSLLSSKKAQNLYQEMDSNIDK